MNSPDSAIPDLQAMLDDASGNEGPVPLSADSLPENFWQRLEDHPYDHDLFQVLRWLDARAGAGKRLGRAATPRHEPVRLRQVPHMVFAPSTLAAVERPQAGRPAVLSVYGFGLFGPNGPLPLHMTEYARERLIHHGDSTLAAFADLFHHRLILLFYRAWANAQSAASLDDADENFSRYLASLLHRGMPAHKRSDSIADHAKYGMVGHLLRQTRNPEGLIQILGEYFGVPVQLQEFVPRWVRLDPSERLRLRQAGTRLGSGTVLGAAVRDGQHAFRLVLGPLRLADYMQFLPGRKKARQLRDWVREYLGLEFAWDAQLVLDRRDVSGVRLNEGITPLGQASWLGHRAPGQGHRRDLIIVPEAASPGDTARRGTFT